MGEPNDTHLDIEIKSSSEEKQSNQVPDPVQDNESPREKIPFYGARFGRRKESTWVISLFVVLNSFAFIATMGVNDCPGNSHQDCVLRSLRRFSFQPLKENPLLGPSSSTLDTIGALQRSRVAPHHQQWRLVTCTWLHAGLIHVIVNVGSLILIGVRLEEEFGPLRIGIIYLLSAFLGSLVSALFIQSNPSVGASSALFGLVGATFSGIVRNWSIYTAKLPALLFLSFVAVSNLFLGLLPHVDNFANIGGLLSGVLLGFVLFFDLRDRWADRKKGLFGYYDLKVPINRRQKLDKPSLRIIALILFLLSLAGGLVAVLHGVDANKYCSWCHYFDCVPTKRWSCTERDLPCETSVSDGRLMMTCQSNGNFRIYPFANITKARLRDFCSEICS